METTEKATVIRPDCIPAGRQLCPMLFRLKDLKFGSYFLFQEYGQAGYDGTQYKYSVGRPVLAIYVAALPCDQTVEVVYLPWFNEQYTYQRNAEYKYPETQSHIEWSNYADVLGVWQHRPTWREILEAYRKASPVGVVKSEQINWHKY